MKPLIILTSLNFVVCCLLIVKSRWGDYGPDPNTRPVDAVRKWDPIDPDKDPGDLSLKDLLEKPRAELARLADEYEEQIIHQEAKRRQGELQFQLLPKSTRFPMAWPIWRQARYSVARDMILPPYLGDADYDSNLALHLARYGDVEAARKIVEPSDAAARAEIDRLALRRNYPAEWTRLVALILHRAHYSLAEANNDGAKRVVALHRQLYNLMNDNEVRQSRLATVLLSRGRTLLHEAVLSWTEGEGGQEEYVDLASVGLTSWGNSPVPMLPPADSPQQLAAWLGGKADGLLVTSGNTLRALDMLELPLPGEDKGKQFSIAPVEGVVGLFGPAGKLREILVVYGHIADAFESARLTYWLDEQVANSSRLHLGFDYENYPNGNKDGKGYITPITIVRLAPRDTTSANQTAAYRLPRDFGPVHLDRTFENNRRLFGWSQPGSKVTVKEKLLLAAVRWPYAAEQKFLQGTMNREADTDLLSDLQLVLEKGAAGHGLFIDSAAPLWKTLGAGRIEVTGPAGTDSVNLVWSDGATQLALRVRNDQEEVRVVVRDASGRTAQQRLTAAQERDDDERRVRWNEDNKLPQRVRRSFEYFELGKTRSELERKLFGRQVLRSETPAGDLLTFPTAPPDDSEWVMRQCLVRFDEKTGKLTEVRIRYTDAGKKAGKVQRLLDVLRNQCGAAEMIADPQSRPGADAKNPSKLMRWQDDTTYLEARVEPTGIELVLKDCPLEHPRGLPLPPANWLPRGPEPRLTLGVTKGDLLKYWSNTTELVAKDDLIASKTAQRGLIIGPGDKSPYDAYIVYLENDRVTRILARFRVTDGIIQPTQPEKASKALTLAWVQHAQSFGWPWQQSFNSRGHLQAWSNHDESTQVSVFWQNQNHGDAGLRIFTEWK